MEEEQPKKTSKGRLLKDLSFLTSFGNDVNNDSIDDIDPFGDGTEATFSSIMARNRESIGLEDIQVEEGPKSLIKSKLQQGKLPETIASESRYKGSKMNRKALLQQKKDKLKKKEDLIRQEIGGDFSPPSMKETKNQKKERKIIEDSDIEESNETDNDSYEEEKDEEYDSEDYVNNDVDEELSYDEEEEETGDDYSKEDEDDDDDVDDDDDDDKESFDSTMYNNETMGDGMTLDYSDDDDDDEFNNEGKVTKKMKKTNANELNISISKEMKTLQKEDVDGDKGVTLIRQTTSRQRRQGDQARLHQKVWSGLLEGRILLQPAFVSANKLPRHKEILGAIQTKKELKPIKKATKELKQTLYDLLVELTDTRSTQLYPLSVHNNDEHKAEEVEKKKCGLKRKHPEYEEFLALRGSFGTDSDEVQEEEDEEEDEDKENNMRKKSNKKQRVNSSAANSTDAIRKLGEWIERDNQLCYESWRPVLDYWHSKSTLSALGYQKTATTLEDFKVNRVNTNNR